VLIIFFGRLCTIVPRFSAVNVIVIWSPLIGSPLTIVPYRSGSAL
jgi:hypothetical protein